MLLAKTRFSLLAFLEDNAETFLAEARALPPEEFDTWLDSGASNLPWPGFMLIDRDSPHVLPEGLPDPRTLVPRSVALLDQRPEVIFAGYSVLRPGAHIPSHKDLKPDSTLRCHLGISVPTAAAMRVANRLLRWEEGRTLVFDGNVDHEAINLDAEHRVVMLVDFHMTDEERRYVDEVQASVDPAWLVSGAGEGIFDEADVRTGRVLHRAEAGPRPR